MTARRLGRYTSSCNKVSLVVQVLEDVSEEHARKTITVEKFPHMPMITAASIHPCKHAVTMKKLSSMMETDTHHITVDRWGLKNESHLYEARAAFHHHPAIRHDTVHPQQDPPGHETMSVGS